MRSENTPISTSPLLELLAWPLIVKLSVKAAPLISTIPVLTSPVAVTLLDALLPLKVPCPMPILPELVRTPPILNVLPPAGGQQPTSNTTLPLLVNPVDVVTVTPAAPPLFKLNV